jgi:cbb3-type cytochrome c oxidase subunit III
MREELWIPLLAAVWTTLGAVHAEGQDGAAKPADLGKQVFLANCAVCHGEGGKGDGAVGVGLEPPPANFTDKEWLFGGDLESVKKTITTGVANTAMPPWGSALKPEEIEAVATYVIAFSGGAGPPAATAPAASPPAAAQPDPR